MEIQFTLSAAESELADQLGPIVGSDPSVEASLAPYAKAAFLEYLDMMTGQRLVASVSDLREYRLFRIAIALGRLPDDNLVADLFQLTPSRSRALLNTVAAKYHYALDGELNQAMYDAINGEPEGGEYDLSPSLLDALQARIKRIDSQLPPIVKVENKSTYTIPPGTRGKLLADLKKRGVKT